MARKNHGKIHKSGKKLADTVLGDLLRKHPKLIHVLHKHGITFCAGCYITLLSPLGKVPGFHAVPDKEKFMADIRRALGK